MCIWQSVLNMHVEQLSLYNVLNHYTRPPNEKESVLLSAVDWVYNIMFRLLSKASYNMSLLAFTASLGRSTLSRTGVYSNPSGKWSG